MARSLRAVTYLAMLSFNGMKGWALAVGVVFAVPAMAQDTLTLDEALALARERNGSLAAAYKDVDAARARTRQSYASFFPTVTPSFSYQDQRQDVLTGPGRGVGVSSGITTEVDARWRLLDTGERDLNYRGSRVALDVQVLETQQTLRGLLADVYVQYFDTLRAQQLVLVTTAQVERAQKALDQTLAQIRVGEAAEKDRFQPEADMLNARVDLLSAQARQRSAEALLRATIGLEPTQPMPQLEPFDAPSRLESELTLANLDEKQLDAFVAEGLTNRLDLMAARKRLTSQDIAVRLARVRSGITWTVDVAYNKQFNADNINTRTLGVFASFPLFDGGLRRAEVDEAVANQEGAELQYVQSERSARANIVTAFQTAKLNADRVAAARAARDAARINYERVSRAQELGAQGVDVVAVSTAQVTLATAERNYVEAIYDLFISNIDLRLAVGRAIRGEEPVQPEREE